MRINCSFSVAAMVVAVIGPVALGDLIPMDPPPRPSGGSGAIAGNLGGPMRVEAHDRSETNAAPVLLPRGPTSETPPPRISFNGVIGTPVYLIPPDTHLAVGPGLDQAGRIVMVTNHYVQIWDKTGSIVAGPTLLNSMFPPSGPFSFDPKILYDQHSGRFFIICLDGKSDTPGLSNVQIGVSSGSVPNNLSSDWTILAGSALETIDGSETWFDYPGIGADDNALFVTGNMFTFSSPVTFKGVKIRVFDKAALIAGNYSFNDIVLDAAQHTGLATVQPAHVFGATDNRGFYLVARYGSTLYRMINVTGAPTNPTISLHGLFPWDGGTIPTDQGADQLGSSVDLDTIAFRVMNAVYRDGHVWLCLTSDPDNDGETEVVWQDISTNNNSPTVFQHGYIDGIGTNSWTYMPSIAVNEAGDAAICYTQSSTSEYAGVYYAMRVGTDPSGTFRGPALALAGVGFYDSFLDGTLDRWGDYSAAVIDPTDDCFWMANEFAWTSQVDDSKWGTYIASFCSEPLDCNGNGIDDADDIAQGTSQDCNTNEIPDECDLIDGTSEDCDEDAIPDECGTDCNGNGLADSCDLAEGTSQDCNANEILDECDIAEGTSADVNGDSIPDECQEPCLTNDDCDDGIDCTIDYCSGALVCEHLDILCLCEGDANGDGTVDPLDSGYVLARFGCSVGTGDPSCDAADQNGDGAVDPLDSGFVLARFGDCP